MSCPSTVPLDKRMKALFNSLLSCYGKWFYVQLLRQFAIDRRAAAVSLSDPK